MKKSSYVFVVLRQLDTLSQSYDRLHSEISKTYFPSAVKRFSQNASAIASGIFNIVWNLQSFNYFDPVFASGLSCAPEMTICWLTSSSTQ